MSKPEHSSNVLRLPNKLNLGFEREHVFVEPFEKRVLRSHSVPPRQGGNTDMFLLFNTRAA